MTQQPDLQPRQATALRVQPLGDELLLYAPEQGVVHILNPTARVIWEACDGNNTPATLTRLLHDRFELGPDQSPAQDVMRTLHELRRLCLIDWG